MANLSLSLDKVAYKSLLPRSGDWAEMLRVTP